MIVLVSHHTGRRLAEIAFLLILFAGVWLAFTEMPQLGFAKGRAALGGVALAVAGVLLIVATHWGHFG